MTTNRRQPTVHGRRPPVITAALAICICAAQALAQDATVNCPGRRNDLRLYSQVQAEFLRTGYRLYRALDGPLGDPIAYSLKAVVLDEKGCVISSPRHLADLSAFIGEIASAKEALAYVRVTTSFPDFLMFDDGLLEIQAGDNFLRIPEDLRARMSPPTVLSRPEGGFEIERDLVKVDKAYQILSVFRSAERVDRRGNYQMKVLRIYPVAASDLGIHLPE